MTSWQIYNLQMTWWQNDKMTRWHDDMTLPWSLITILCLLSKVYRLKCLKFETKTHSLTHLLTRVKSRDVFLNTHPSLVTTLIIDAVMTLLTVISMTTKMTISDDNFWWHISKIHDTRSMMMIYDDHNDIWYMIYDDHDDICFLFYDMIWYV